MSGSKDKFILNLSWVIHFSVCEKAQYIIHSNHLSWVNSTFTSWSKPFFFPMLKPIYTLDLIDKLWMVSLDYALVCYTALTIFKLSYKYIISLKYSKNDKWKHLMTPDEQFQ